MKQCVIFLPVLILLAVSPVFAQTPTPAPWPPNPEQIFADGVVWEEVIRPAASPAPEVDNDARIIRVYDETQASWQEFPFPDDFDHVDYVDRQPDGQLRMKSYKHFYYVTLSLPEPEPDPEELRILDLSTGIYTRPASVCNGRIFKADPGNGRWVVAVFDDGGEGHAILCHSETGEMRDVLPDDYVRWRVATSPDNSWLVLVGYSSSAFPVEFHILAYDLHHDTFQTLGSIDIMTSESMPGVCGWLSDTQGVLCAAGDHNWQAGLFYTFDVTQAESLSLASHAWGETLYTVTNPTRYVTLNSTEYSNKVTWSLGPHRPCTLTVIDAAGVRQHELGYDCVLFTPDNDFYCDYTPGIWAGDTLYYLTTASDDAPISDLRSFNLVSETGNEALFTGEIEAILNVSPDQRYIVLLIDDNGALDRDVDRCSDQWRGGWQVAIFDQDTGTIIYRSEPIGVYLPTQVVWLDEHTIFVSAADDFTAITVTLEGDTIFLTSPSSMRRIVINRDDTLDIQITTRFALDLRDYRVAPNNRYVFSDNTLFDMIAFEPVLVLRDDIPADYEISSRWTDDSRLRVTVKSKTTSEHVTYLITLP